MNIFLGLPEACIKCGCNVWTFTLADGSGLLFPEDDAPYIPGVWQGPKYRIIGKFEWLEWTCKRCEYVHKTDCVKPKEPGQVKSYSVEL
jgi:hypothetical protein